MFSRMMQQLELACCVFLLSLCPAFAIAAGPTPGAVDETLPSAPAQELPTTEETISPPEPTPPVPAGGPQIKIKSFEFAGNSVISTSILQAEVAEYVGQSLTLLEIYAVADELTRFYRDAGYTVASVTVPAQNVTTGNIRFEVIEGRIGRILLDGNQMYNDAMLGKHIEDRLKPEVVLNNPELERELLLLNDLPGISTRVVVQPGARYGQSDLLFRSSEKRVNASVSFDNHGREELGTWRAGGNFNLNNPLGQGDRLGASLLHAQGGQLDYGRLNYSFPINTNGTRATLTASHYDYQVDTKDLGPLFVGTTLEGQGNYFSAGISHPLIRSRQQNLFLGAGISHTSTRQSGTFVLPGDESSAITLLDMNAYWNHQHAGGHAVTNVLGVVSTNFKSNSSGIEDNAQLFKLQVDGTHLRRLIWGWDLQLRARGVISPHTLVDTQKVRLGGPDSVRAYPAAEVAGDRGVEASVEFQYPFVWPEVGNGKFRLFWDGGIVYRTNPGAGVNRSSSLTGIGAGASFNIKPGITLDLLVAQPTHAQQASDGDDTRAWLVISGYF
ncbi:MAG: ShlB/FhaC/HecB family hemolysin secretion/activation protein [Gammaproteobacteria bacterium]